MLLLILPKTLRLFLFSVFILLAPSALAQTSDVPSPAVDSSLSEETKAFVVADVNIGDVQATEVDGVVSGTFSLRGNMGQQNRIVFAVVVRDEDGVLLHVQPFENEASSIREGEIKTVPFSYRLPNFLSGAVVVFIQAETTGGLPLGAQKVLEKKLPENSRPPVECTVSVQEPTFSCHVAKDAREVLIKYYSRSLFVPPVRTSDVMSITGSAKKISPELPPGRYWVAVEEAETGRTAYFPFRITGSYGVIQNAVVSSGEETGVVQVVVSTMASPIKGASATIDLRDNRGVACGSADMKSEGAVKEATMAVSCVSGIIKVELKSATGEVLDSLEEPFSVLSGEGDGRPMDGVGRAGMTDQESSPVSIIWRGLTALLILVGTVVGILVYRSRQRKVGMLVVSIAVSAAAFGGMVPNAEALTLHTQRFGSSEIAWDCLATVSLDKATYILGEPATISATIDMYGDVDSRGMGNCSVSYGVNATSTNAAFDSEYFGSLQTIASAGPVPMGGSDNSVGNRLITVPAYLSVGPHTVRRIQLAMTGNCWGGCGTSIWNNIGSLGFSANACPGAQYFASEIVCDRSSDWGATWDGGPTAYCTSPADCSAQQAALRAGFCTGLWDPPSAKFPCFCTIQPGACVNIAPPVPTACRTNLVVQSNDVCPANCGANMDIYRVSNPSTGVYNEAWWNTSSGSFCSGSCASYPLQGRELAEITALPFCALPPPPICVLGASAWAGIVGGNYSFAGAGGPGSQHIKDSLCPAGEVMVGTRSSQYTRDVDDEYEEARCAPGASGLGASYRIEAPNAFATENPGTKIALCGAGEVAVGVRMFGVFSAVDEEHIDVYCAPFPSAVLNTAASHWVSAPNAGSTLFGGFKTQTCPGGEVVTGVRWFQWPSNVDEEHTDVQCTPITLACGAAANISVSGGAIVSLPDTWWQKLWKFIRGADNIAHAGPPAANIVVNQGVNFSWSSSGVTACQITANPAALGFPLNMPPQPVAAGSQSIPPYSLNPGTTYRLTMTCTGATGGASDFADIVVAPPADFKVCPTTPVIAPLGTTQMRAYYVTSGTVNCGSLVGAVEVTTDPSTSWSSANAGIASVNNAGSKGLVTGVTSGIISISATYMTSSDSENVTVSCTPTAACTDAGPTATAANTCAGATFNIPDGCSGVIVCNGTRTCDFNWKEVGQ